ncbi:MAG: hypothetical protein M1834_002159 [Cirrosporium novae-zelandiae]|nr:MAG: hypothetical protein M1834_002159 [Cirrosporium novae-zelandiae]
MVERKRPSAVKTETSNLPIGELLKAHKSDIEDLRISKAVGFLEQFVLLGPMPDLDRASSLCKEYGVSPSTLYRLALVINSSSAHQTGGYPLIYCASALGHCGATIHIIINALSGGKLQSPRIASARRHLADLVKAKYRPAMVLQGKVLESQGQLSKAIDLYFEAQKITVDPSASVDENVGQLGKYLSPGLALADALAKRSNSGDKGIKAALEKAALEEDEPMAYYLLSNLLQDRRSDTYRDYNLKAAQTGISMAANNLGCYYMSVSSAHSDNTLLARDWFEVAAQAGIGKGQLMLAVILHGEGLITSGRAWLEKAEGDPTVTSIARDLKKMWDHDHSSIRKRVSGLL